jgi:hypothetical protein
VQYIARHDLYTYIVYKSDKLWRLPRATACSEFNGVVTMRILRAWQPLHGPNTLFQRITIVMTIIRPVGLVSYNLAIRIEWTMYTCKITYAHNACIVCAIETVVGVCIAVCRLLEYYFNVGHDTLLAYTAGTELYVSHRSPTRPVVMVRGRSLIISDIWCSTGGPLAAACTHWYTFENVTWCIHSYPWVCNNFFYRVTYPPVRFPSLSHARLTWTRWLLLQHSLARQNSLRLCVLYVWYV